MPICEECGQRTRVEGPQNVRHPTPTHAKYSSYTQEILQVDELKAEIEHVETLMQSLATHRSGLRRRINSLAPISCLPPEILLLVFTHCLSPPTTPPLFLGAICARWRALAWGSPVLWSKLVLRVSRLHAPAQLCLLEAWLLRAGTLPLHIHILPWEVSDEATLQSFRSVLEVLVSRAPYWGSIECDVLPPHCHDLLRVTAPELVFRQLKRVVFRPPKGAISTFSEPPSDMFLGGRVPCLEDVDLVGYDFSSMRLPWKGLRVFRAQFLTVVEGVGVLRMCPGLERCVLENVYFPETHGILGGTGKQQAQLVHSGLETLDVTLVKGAATALLDAVSLPSLKELGLHYVGTESVPLLPVISLVSRSACVLTKFEVSRSVFGEEDLVRCLEALPGLVELSICVREVAHPWGHVGPEVDSEEGLSEGFLRRVVGGGRGHSCLLPGLRRFGYEGPVGCEMRVVLDVLEGRWREFGGGVGLEGVRVASRGMLRMEEEDTARVEKLEREGMDICISPFVF
ncbi:hypothetical protein DFP72DRAFT_1115635 [Ephemerocybe angulata]|uniref:F-box domain-containing protein n=1 Tax=Ephemerocybe angulata TaxID=980116 RepID=A0A8H6I0Z8_9AGAR|nr:hypothetical protein DFP72DRAFT_1115635 [Tulosesus angulatus]